MSQALRIREVPGPGPTPGSPHEWRAVLERLEELTTRVGRLEAIAKREGRRPLRLRLRRTLGWLWGTRICDFQHHGPRPMTLPDHYYRNQMLHPALTISVVTPSFNHARYIERTVRSVIGQGFPRLEYVVQDGGSKDETLSILMPHRPRLHHLESTPDRGQADAINRGFRHTSGEIMAWLNSDDVFLPGALAFVSDWFNTHPDVDVIYSHRHLIDAQDQLVGTWVLPPHCDTVLTWADYVPQETMFWRRRIWDKVGGKLDDTFQFALDWDLLLRFREVGAKIVRVPRFLAAFRIHDSQKSYSQITTIGEAEMKRLRERTHGRSISHPEVLRNLRSYLFKQGLYHRLYSWGLLPV